MIQVPFKLIAKGAWVTVPRELKDGKVVLNARSVTSANTATLTVWRRCPQPPSTLAMVITAASKANPCVITATDNLSDGDRVVIASVGGMTELNTNKYYVKRVEAGLFALYTDITLTTAVNSTGYTTYTTGGTATVIPRYCPVLRADTLVQAKAIAIAVGNTRIGSNDSYVTSIPLLLNGAEEIYLSETTPGSPDDISYEIGAFG